jgi:uncharacterized membrane protein
MKLVLSFILTTLVFLAIDIVWLGWIAKNLYNKMIGHLLSPQVNWIAAIIFYFLFIIGIFIFAILPAIEKDAWKHALLYGALFGFFTYATYELTNLATLRQWPASLVFIDIAWGVFLSASVATAGFFITRALR